MPTFPDWITDRLALETRAEELPAPQGRAIHLHGALAGLNDTDILAWTGGSNLTRLLDPADLDGEWWRAVAAAALDGERYLRTRHMDRFGIGDGLDGLRPAYTDAAVTRECAIITRHLDWLENQTLTEDLTDRLKTDSITEARHLSTLTAGWW